MVFENTVNTKKQNTPPSLNKFFIFNNRKQIFKIGTNNTSFFSRYIFFSQLNIVIFSYDQLIINLIYFWILKFKLIYE